MLILITELFLSLFTVPSIHGSFLTAKDGTINQMQIIQTCYCSITSCYLTCNRNPDCDMIAVPSDATLGTQKECFHVKNLPMGQEVIDPIDVILISQEKRAEKSMAPTTMEPAIQTTLQTTVTTLEPAAQTVDKLVEVETNGKICEPQTSQAAVTDRAHCKNKCIQERARYCMNVDLDHTYCMWAEKCDDLRDVPETYTVWERVDVAFLDSPIDINGNLFWGRISTIKPTFVIRFNLYLQTIPTSWNTLMEITQLDEINDVQTLILNLQIKGMIQGRVNIKLSGFTTDGSSSFTSDRNWLPVEIKQYQDQGTNKYYLSMTVNGGAQITIINTESEAKNVDILIGETGSTNFGYIKQLEFLGADPWSS